MATSTITANPITVSISAKVSSSDRQSKYYVTFVSAWLSKYYSETSNDIGIFQENEWVAPQFHRKVHVNNRIYIEGAGIEKVTQKILSNIHYFIVCAKHGLIFLTYLGGDAY